MRVVDIDASTSVGISMNASDSEIALSVQRLIADYGHDAARKAQIRADWLDKVGASAAAATWQRIAARCRDLLETVGTP